MCAFDQRFYSFDAHAGCKQTIVRGRRTAALNVTENGHAGFESNIEIVNALGQVCGADARTFGIDDDGVGLAALVCFFHCRSYFIGCDRHFGNKRNFRAADDGSHDGKVAAIAPHGLHQKRTLVRGSGIAQFIHGFHDGVHGGICTNGNVRTPDVIVNTARDADHLDALL